MSPTVSTLWVGNSLSPYELLSLASFARRGHETLIYSYEDLGTLPHGVRAMPAESVLPADKVFANPDRPGTYAAFSNIFRYHLLQRRDTVWFDTDVICLDKLPVEDYLFGWESPHFINGAVLGLPSNSSLIGALRDRADAIGDSVGGWGVLGPKLITSLTREMSLQGLAKPVEYFYPILYQQVWRLFDPKQTDWVRKRIEGSYTLHLWNEVMRTAPIEIKASQPHPESFLGLLFAEMGVKPNKTSVVKPFAARHRLRFALRDYPGPVVRLERRIKSVGRMVSVDQS